MADTIRTGIVGATVTQGGSGWGANAQTPPRHPLRQCIIKLTDCSRGKSPLGRRHFLPLRQAWILQHVVFYISQGATA